MRIAGREFKEFMKKGVQYSEADGFGHAKGLHLHHMGCLETSLVSNPFKIVARGLFMQEICGFGNAE